MLVRRWAPPLEDEMRVLARYCGLVVSVSNPFSCTHLSSVHASHISQLLQLAPWSTPEGPLMQCKCQHQLAEEGSDPSAAPPARRRHEDFELSSVRPRPACDLFLCVFPLPVCQSAAVVRCTTAGTIRDCKQPPSPTTANRWRLDAHGVGHVVSVQICILPTTRPPIKVPFGRSFVLWGPSEAQHSLGGGTHSHLGVLTLPSWFDRQTTLLCRPPEICPACKTSCYTAHACSILFSGILLTPDSDCAVLPLWGTEIQGAGMCGVPRT